MFACVTVYVVPQAGASRDDEPTAAGYKDIVRELFVMDGRGRGDVHDGDSDDAGSSDGAGASRTRRKQLKSAPAGSLLALLALRMAGLGSLPRMAALWWHFVKELRYCWENAIRLPRMVSAAQCRVGPPDGVANASERVWLRVCSIHR